MNGRPAKRDTLAARVRRRRAQLANDIDFLHPEKKALADGKKFIEDAKRDGLVPQVFGESPNGQNWTASGDEANKAYQDAHQRRTAAADDDKIAPQTRKVGEALERGARKVEKKGEKVVKGIGTGLLAAAVFALILSSGSS